MSAHDQKRAAMAANLEEQTGRTVEQWADILRAAQITGFMDSIGWLKAEHGLGHFQARLVVEVSRAGDL